MPFGPRLVGRTVVLREMEPDDAVERRALGWNAEIERMFGTEHPETRPMSQAESECWASEVAPEGSIGWIVEADGRFLGDARLHSFRRNSARFAIGFFDPSRLGQGFGQQATRLVVRYAFEELRLRSVMLATLAINDRALHCYRRCGFREIDRVPAAAVVDGESLDDIIMAIEGRSLGD
jgi:RimJ/RimL family protein N-acetyltransferase